MGEWINPGSMGMTYDLVADYLDVGVLLDNPTMQNSMTQSELTEFQRFVQSRTYILASRYSSPSVSRMLFFFLLVWPILLLFVWCRPEQTFAQAANLPDSSAPAKKAMARWYAGKESRPWIKLTNKNQSTNPCIMTFAGPLSIDWSVHVG